MMRNLVVFSLCVALICAAEDSGSSSEPEHVHHDQRIIDGELAKPGQFPYIVRMTMNNKYNIPSSCAGIILSEVFLLSAGHCCFKASNVTVSDLNAKEDDGTEQIRSQMDVVVHENYVDEIPPPNDICFLKLHDPLIFNEYVSSIPLPGSYEEMLSGQRFLIVGWGLTWYPGASTSRELRWGMVDNFNFEECRRQYSQHDCLVNEDMICAAGRYPDNFDTCDGDSGGPLVKFDPQGTNLLAGIASWGYKCGLPDFPGVYTKVSHFVDWIQEQKRNYS
ncbi:unnamed protein product [Notodromas monacha]|uniref:Peptidase S1 domain-containing protein n=1 Tax=Notodromas monacha TaxID=399045 RepID=A0A7R9GH14_9CRUS|nr:unnamed protein product [Notodromas monacha]CAG0920444.1 unnamed protein product [Notodromas monacha]